jgi:hypothetical protein
MVRAISPCPTTVSGFPGSRLALPQAAQNAGRTEPHVGVQQAQGLTPITE